MFAAQGAKVKLVALTNGDVGHFAQAGGPLAQRRKAEVEACHKMLNIETDVLDIHDGELMADLPTRKKVANLIRDWQADIVLSHRPWDYHPDHRAVGQLANDTAVVVAAPFFAPYTPPVKLNPVYLYYPIRSRTPIHRSTSPWASTASRRRSGTASRRCRRSSATPIPGRRAIGSNIPTDEAARKAALIEIVKQSNADIADKYRDLLVKCTASRKAGRSSTPRRSS